MEHEQEVPKKRRRRKTGMEAVEKRIRVGQLMDRYGGLLTERQQKFIRMHYDEDLSFAEIARDHGVSRQAIHDAVKHGEQALENYESKLGLLRKGEEPAAAPAPAESTATAPDMSAPSREALSDGTKESLREAAAELRALEEKLRKAGGIIYDGAGIQQQVGEIAAKIESALSE